jgi:tetratricopeptide (TPR) repeat protein
LVALSAAAVILQLPGLAAAQRIDQSRNDFKRADYSASVKAADQAVAAEPWSAEAYGQRGLAYEAAGNLNAAARDLKTARAKEPTNWAWPLLLVRIETERGNPAAARADLAEAKRLRPHASIFNHGDDSVR